MLSIFMKDFHDSSVRGYNMQYQPYFKWLLTKFDKQYCVHYNILIFHLRDWHAFGAGVLYNSLPPQALRGD